MLPLFNEIQFGVYGVDDCSYETFHTMRPTDAESAFFFFKKIYIFFVFSFFIMMIFYFKEIYFLVCFLFAI